MLCTYAWIGSRSVQLRVSRLTRHLQNRCIPSLPRRRRRPDLSLWPGRPRRRPGPRVPPTHQPWWSTKGDVSTCMNDDPRAGQAPPQETFKAGPRLGAAAGRPVPFVAISTHDSPCPRPCLGLPTSRARPRRQPQLDAEMMTLTESACLDACAARQISRPAHRDFARFDPNTPKARCRRRRAHKLPAVPLACGTGPGSPNGAVGMSGDS